MATGEALLARLWSLFQQDPLIDEVGLLFGVEQSGLTTETAFFLEEHKLGVAFAAGIPLFQSARSQFHPLNALLQQDEQALALPEGEPRCAQLLHCTSAILLISADFYTAWNTRKAFVAKGWLDAQDEVQFTNLVFTLHPKSIDTWAYRRWLAVRLCGSLYGDALRMFFEQQIEVCSRLAKLKARNYHAWSFRHWIVSRLPFDLAFKELADMERWCRTHVTDHSGWNHRQHTLNVLVKRYQASGDADGSSEKLVLAEFKFVSEVMAPYPTHEALWCHRRYVMQCLLNQARKAVPHDAVPLQDLASRVAGTLATVKPADVDTATLRASWDDTMKFLSREAITWSSVLPAILHEIETAWTCGTRFSRRYAAWCLARLRFFLRRTQPAGDKERELAYELGHLALSLQEHLVQEDSVLEDLWLRT